MCLEDKELELLRAAMATLEPFCEVTVEMSAELQTSASKIIQLAHLLQECLSEDITELGNLLMSQLQERFKTVNSKDHLRLSTMRDPRCDTADEAGEKLEEVAENVVFPQTSQEQLRETTERAPTPAKKPSLLWSSLDSSRVLKERACARHFTAADTEVGRRLESPSLSRETNPLDWWRFYAVSTPRLARIAKDVWGIPATSVPQERLFSKAGDLLISRKRSAK